MKKLSDFGKFLAKYSGEVGVIATGFRTILSGLSIGAQDRAKIEQAIEMLETASSSVAAAANGFKPVEVTVQKSDVEAAVAKAMPAIVSAELKKLGIEQVGENTANVEAIVALVMERMTAPGDAGNVEEQNNA